MFLATPHVVCAFLRARTLGGDLTEADVVAVFASILGFMTMMRHDGITVEMGEITPTQHLI